MTVNNNYDFSEESSIKEPLFEKMSDFDAQLRPNTPVREEISFADLSSQALTKSRTADPPSDERGKQYEPPERSL